MTQVNKHFLVLPLKANKQFNTLEDAQRQLEYAISQDKHDFVGLYELVDARVKDYRVEKAEIVNEAPAIGDQMEQPDEGGEDDDINFNQPGRARRDAPLPRFGDAARAAQEVFAAVEIPGHPNAVNQQRNAEILRNFDIPAAPRR